MQTNNSRYDLSNHLIHFFRDVDISSSDAPPTPEHWGYSSVTEDWKMPAFFLLRHAIRQGRLWATWSVRNGKRTIYGDRPAVCFTEMPIAAFVEASQIRFAKGEAMGTCAIVLPKSATFQVGARPVIYGLSADAWSKNSANNGERSFQKDVLPVHEQYRYVAYNPTKKTLDWTHEREWRWPLDSDAWSDDDGLPPSDSDVLPGLNHDSPILQGLGVIVASKRQANKIIHDVLTKVDRNDIADDHYSFILAWEDISNWQELRDYNEMQQAITDNLIRLEKFFALNKKDAKKLVLALEELTSEIEADADKPGPEHFDEGGGCWLWIKDNRHPLVRALVKLNRIVIDNNGRYLLDLPQIDPNRPLRQRQELVVTLCEKLEIKVGIAASYYSVVGSTNPNEIPSYTGDIVSDPLFYNFNWDDDELEEEV